MFARAKRAGLFPALAGSGGRATVLLFAPVTALALVAGGFAYGLHHAADRFTGALLGQYTLELPAMDPGGGGPVFGQGDAAASGRDYEREVVAFLAEAGEVRAVEAVDPAAVAALIEPWLGGAPPQALPLPRFYDVLLQPGREALTPALLAEFAALAPDARLERYDAWNAPLLRSAGRLRALSLAGLALAAAAFALAAFHAARGALLAHRETVRLVHRLGATDGFLAREVARGARRLGFQGALWGALLAAPLLAAAFAALPRADSLQDGSLQTLPLQAGLPWQLWLALFAAPFAAAALAGAVAHLGVRLLLWREA